MRKARRKKVQKADLVSVDGASVDLNLRLDLLRGLHSVSREVLVSLDEESVQLVESIESLSQLTTDLLTLRLPFSVVSRNKTLFLCSTVIRFF